MNTLVSVILPVYNRERLVCRCLDSLLNNDYKNIEIVCVDDASTDGSLSVLQHYAAQDDRVKIFHHEANKNAGGARNTAIQNAKGEYLYFVDSDDWVDKDAISDLMKASHNGYYDTDEHIIKELVRSEAKLVLCALGAGKQELFIKKCRESDKNGVYIGVGGSFDVWAGAVKRAPILFRKLGLEWAYRTLNEPKRIKRIYKTLPMFLFRAIIESMKR